MKINRLVLDLSHHEIVKSYDSMRKDGIHGIIYKATQGTGYRDNTYWKEKERALKAGMLWGSYHFAENTNVIGQVENYLEYAKPGKGELVCLDLEDYGSKTMMLSQARQFIEEVERRLDRPLECVIYSGNTIKEMLDERKDNFWGSRRLWLAQYGSTPSVQASWETYWLWQYSDGEVGPEPHDVKGTDDFVDSNHFDGTPEELRAQWSGGGEPLPTPEIKVKILISAPPGVTIEVTQT